MTTEAIITTGIWLLKSTTLEPDDHDDDDHGHEAPESTPLSRTIDITFLTLAALLGALTNLTIPLALKVNRRLRTSSNILFVNIVVADLVICLYILPLTIATRVAERNLLSNVGCGVNSFLLFVGMGVSNFTFMAIAIDRYIYIFHTNHHRRLFTTLIMTISVTAVWVLWLIYGVAILVVLNGFDYEPDAYICFFADSKNDLTSALILSLIHFLLPFLVAVCSYIAITTRTMISRRRARLQYAGNNTNSNAGEAEGEGRSRGDQDSNRVIIYLCITTVAFFLCWAPYTFHSLLVQANIHFPMILHKAMYWLTLVNPAINGIIFGPMNTRIRQTLIRWFRENVMGNKVAPINEDRTTAAGCHS